VRDNTKTYVLFDKTQTHANAMALYMGRTFHAREGKCFASLTKCWFVLAMSLA